MVTLKILRDWAREEGIVGFSRMNKAELLELWEESQPERPRKYLSLQPRKEIPVLNLFITKVLPKNIVGIVETSVNKAIDWVDRLKQARLKLKEKTREKLLRLNAKIGELLKKPEFENEEKPGLGGTKFIVKGKEGYSAEGFLKNVRAKVIEILKKTTGVKAKMVLHCLMSSADLKTGMAIKDIGFFSSGVGDVFEGTDLKRFGGSENESESESEEEIGEWIPLPTALAKKKALINMKNEDQKFFKWCVTRWFFPADHPEKIVENL